MQVLPFFPIAPRGEQRDYGKGAMTKSGNFRGILGLYHQKSGTELMNVGEMQRAGGIRFRSFLRRS